MALLNYLDADHESFYTIKVNLLEKLRAPLG
jgi:hypothetical protein